MDELSAFKHRLPAAMSWCTPRASIANPAQCLRSPLLIMDYAAETDGALRHTWDTVVARVSLVDAVAARREELLSSEKEHVATEADTLREGRLLLYYPDLNLADGAAFEESQGYFDVDNTPPWDTWLFYVHDELWQRDLEDRLRPGVRHGPLEHGSSNLVSWVAPRPIGSVNSALGRWLSNSALR